MLLTPKQGCIEKGFDQMVALIQIIANITVGHFTMLKCCTGCPSEMSVQKSKSVHPDDS